METITTEAKYVRNNILEHIAGQMIQRKMAKSEAFH